MKYTKDDLVKYRVKRAEEAFKDGEILATRNSWDSAANRMYYACFYIISAYLAEKGYLWNFGSYDPWQV